MLRRSRGGFVACGLIGATASIGALLAVLNDLSIPALASSGVAALAALAAILPAPRHSPRRGGEITPIPPGDGDELNWRHLLDGLGDGVWEWYPASGRMCFSDGWKAVLGPSDVEIGESIESWAETIHPEDRARTLGDIEAYLAGDTGLYQNEHRVVRSDGEIRWVSDRAVVAARDEDGSPTLLVGVRNDITQRKEMEDQLWRQAVEISNAAERLAEMAITDALTGVRNRRGFMTRAEEMLARPVPAGAVISLDVDFFKRVNDTWGHETGDDVLREIARRLLAHAPDADLVARMGGEEFAVLCPGLTCREALAIAVTLRRAVGETPIATAGGRSLSITISLGVTCAVPNDNVSTMLSRADQALYEAKNDGRDRERVHCPTHTQAGGMEAAE